MTSEFIRRNRKNLSRDKVNLHIHTNLDNMPQRITYRTHHELDNNE